MLAFTAILLAPLAVMYSAETGPEGRELLRDPACQKGVTQGYANHLPADERADCLTRWKAKGLGQAQWAFWEISEKLHFAHILSRSGWMDSVACSACRRTSSRIA